ncbi:hypothetical protein MYRNA_15 [Mycobacterium phage Myrna]|uniref:Uncharacterized protein n=1 Tax=Mycobacterium phage Myrna TaxID=546805 RepID=B5LJ26_9CAUD|nr:gp15 [Mycobacterium phage Myrna]ACH62023.1 hypothetical protein MYRNA_15 [Mycobacterium phage Myrna]
MNWPAFFGVLAGAAGIVAFVSFIVNPFLEDPKKLRVTIIAFAVCVACAALAAGLA